jgi:acyl carrier protein
MSEAKLQGVFVSALGIKPGYPFEDLRYRGIEEWDSVAHMTLVSSLEEAFDIMLETNDVIDMSSYVKAREILAKYGVSF